MRLLIFAPHPDDEILGCSALLLEALEARAAARVIVVTDGEAGGDPAVRASESRAGLDVLGAAPPEFWGEKDGELPLSSAIRQRVRAAVVAWRPTQIALPSPSEDHPDHRRLTRAVLSALTGHWRGELVFYETTVPMPLVTRLVPFPLDVKLRALACHASQLGQYAYDAHARGLAAMRGAACGVPAAEGYLGYAWNGTQQHFFEQFELLSVIVRADDSDFLRDALASIAAQAYDYLEVVVVWHGDEPLPDGHPLLDCMIVRGPGGRSANLNAGLRQAGGSLLAFLDQDDVWYPNHLAVLVAELRSDPRLDIAYGDHRVSYCARQDGEVRVLSVGPVAGRDWRRGRLLAGNYIPLHSFVCRTALARRIGFDNALEAYEDWDFLARAELEGALFRHVPELVCEYRVHPRTGERQDLAAIHEARGYTGWRAPILEGLRQRMGSDGFTSLAELVRDLETEASLAVAARDQTAAGLQAADERAELLQVRHDAASRWANIVAPRSLAPPVAVLAARAFQEGAVISIVMPVSDPDPDFLTEVIDSVLRQTYARWELCVADDASQSPEVQSLLARFERHGARDARLRICRRASHGGIVAATRDAVALAGGEWLLFLDHDDRLAPAALLEIAGAIASHPALSALYTDSRTVDRNGVVLNVHRKPDWSPETLLHINYINHLSVVRRTAYDEVGGLTAGRDGCQDWDLWLKLSRLPDFRALHVPEALYDWRASESSVAYDSQAKPYMLEAAPLVLREHLERSGLCGVHSSFVAGAPGLRHSWNAALQPLTAIILTHDNAGDLEILLDGLQACSYPQLRIVLVANRVSPQDRATSLQLDRARRMPLWTVVTDDRPFNWSALNNAAVVGAGTPWLLFLNDDIAMPDPEAFSRLALHLSNDAAVAAVGARLEYGAGVGGGLQHDGIVTDPVWVARNITSAADSGCIGVPRNVSAVTGACLLTRRDAFVRCGGFDERLAVSFNDVDYCLHLRRLGHRIVQGSDAMLVHHESKTRGGIANDAKRRQLQEEASLMRGKWGDFLRERHAPRFERAFAGTRIHHVAR